MEKLANDDYSWSCSILFQSPFSFQLMSSPTDFEQKVLWYIGRTPDKDLRESLSEHQKWLKANMNAQRNNPHPERAVHINGIQSGIVEIKRRLGM